MIPDLIFFGPHRRRRVVRMGCTGKFCPEGVHWIRIPSLDLSAVIIPLHPSLKARTLRRGEYTVDGLAFCLVRSLHIGQWLYRTHTEVLQDYLDGMSTCFGILTKSVSKICHAAFCLIIVNTNSACSSVLVIDECSLSASVRPIILSLCFWLTLAQFHGSPL